ncbi:unnamed protein product [Rotaria sordida]|uniref:Uncharacterized protein n=1 Tax=Rotaria sordida TaxID=392033 RepID=A0A814MYG3_9BILA|nr:unnamed protein product [Rotaria sordida]
MNENNKETFITTLPNDNQVKSFSLNDDDDMNTDVKSSNDSDDGSITNNEISNKQEHQNASLISIANVESINDTEHNILIDEPSLSIIDDQTQITIPKAVYDYAAVVRQTLETPRQTKLAHDVATVLGSNDPPPGFGFLHPQYYYLEQTRPTPLEPLPVSYFVWRGYNGHVYFSPIQVRQFENQRFILPTNSLKSTEILSVPSIRKIEIEQRNTILSDSKNRKTITNTNHHIIERNYNGRSLTKKNTQVGTNSNVKSITSSNELRYPTTVTFIDKEDYKQESIEMWQSVVTCAHVQTKPISKRSRHAMEDLQALQQEQSLQDPTGYNRQVLPNIRPVAKSKFVYKGLAYKESQKLPGIGNGNGNDNDGNALQKPLVSYNLAQAYARYEINAARAKQGIRQPPPTAATAAVLKDQHSPLQTSLDLREMRKRIVRGTTLACRPPPQSVAWTPGRADHRSTLGSETAYRRPSTSKSSIPQKQTTVIEMPILTKNISQPRSSSRFTTASEMIAAAS